MRSAIPLCALALTAAGCHKEPTVVGSWTGTLMGYDVKADFGEDKSLKIGLKDKTMGADIVGTYQVDSKDLTLEPKTYKLKGVADTLLPVANQLMDGVVKQPIKGSYHFNSDDEIALTFKDKVDVLKRVKEDQ